MTVNNLFELSARPEAVSLAIPMPVIRGREQDFRAPVEIVRDAQFTP